MPRTTVTAVLSVLAPGQDYDVVNNPDLTPFIDTASVIVDRVVTCAATKGITLLDTEQELIERWLAAHCYCLSDQPYFAKSTGGAHATFHGKTDIALDATKYGQQAQVLDYSGCLTAIGKRKFASAFWLGKPPSAQVPYWERD
jgi:hypothetical protein